jgi:5-methylcytosine-specific restriction endonuclease McrA
MILKECKVHGVTDFARYKKKNKESFYHKCKKCSSLHVQRRRDKLKILSVEYLGGKCSICGYNKCLAALEFHHLDPSQKDFGISHAGATRSFEKIKKELDKCVLLCANCHREVHSSDEARLDS